MTTRPNDPPIPHFAVIFTAQQCDGDEDLYAETSVAMATLAAQQPGYLAHESARDPDGFGITISYWTDEDAIKAWKMNVEHLAAQRLGLDRFYSEFTVRIARVDRVAMWNR
ncbi:MAG: antibiotic biosynthesis monooxygenase [Alphaproteobacteria bacterium]|nr:antibiotic biosynthesis monooxygenase [Alphaproteobacteria bacterium]